jgi:hypothetical protein
MPLLGAEMNGMEQLLCAFLTRKGVKAKTLGSIYRGVDVSSIIANNQVEAINKFSKYLPLSQQINDIGTFVQYLPRKAQNNTLQQNIYLLNTTTPGFDPNTANTIANLVINDGSGPPYILVRGNQSSGNQSSGNQSYGNQSYGNQSYSGMGGKRTRGKRKGRKSRKSRRI